MHICNIILIEFMYIVLIYHQRSCPLFIYTYNYLYILSILTLNIYVNLLFLSIDVSSPDFRRLGPIRNKGMGKCAKPARLGTGNLGKV